MRFLAHPHLSCKLPGLLFVPFHVPILVAIPISATALVTVPVPVPVPILYFSSYPHPQPHFRSVPCPFRFLPRPRSRPCFNVAFISLPSPPFSFPLPFCDHYRSRPGSRPRFCSRLRFRPRLRSCPRPRSLPPIPKIRLHPRYDKRVQTPVCVWECVCMFT